MQLLVQIRLALQNRSILLQLCVIGLAVIMVGTLVVVLLFGEAPSSRPTPGQALPSPTKDIYSITSPQDKRNDIGIVDPITISFSQKIANEAQVAIFSLPKANFSRKWKNNTTLILTPQGSLQENKKYILTISTGRQSSEISFTTTTKQAAGVKAAAKAGLSQSQLKAQYPWYDKLPLLSGKYQVDFNLEKKSFYAKLFVFREVEVPVLKQTISDKLKTLGVDLDTYPIIWEVVQ